MNRDKQLTLDKISKGFIEEKPASEAVKTVEQRKAQIAEYYKNRMTRLEQSFRVGTDDDRERREYHFDRAFPDDRYFHSYKYLTSSEDKGPLIMFPRKGNELFYCPAGIKSNGSAEATRIDDTTIDEFLKIWNS